MKTNQTERVSDEELDQMIWKLERDGMTPKQLSLMRELREVRRAKGEPVAWDYEWASCITREGPQDFNRIIEREAPPEWAIEEGQARNIIPLYTVPPAPVVSEVNPQVSEVKTLVSEMPTDDERIMEIEGIAHLAPVVPGVIATDDISYSVGRFRTHRDCYRDGWNACRAAMLNHSGDTADMVEHVSNRDELPTNSFTNEDLAGMAHGDNPQANAYRELLARRLNSPATPDGWIPVRERMPENMDTVITSNGFDIGHGWWDGDTWQEWSYHDAVPGDVTHWMPLPAAPKEVG